MRRPLDSYTKITSRHGDTVTGSRFGKHLGTDYATPIGTSLKAPLAGVVTSVTMTPLIGKQIELRGDDGLLHRFAHLSAQSVRAEQRVAEGQVLGLTGNTGTSSTGAHLHWDTRKGGTRWDSAFSNYIDNEAELNKPAPAPTPTTTSWTGKTVYLSARVSAWRTYVPGTKTVEATLNPMKFGGLSYVIRGKDNLGRALIDTKQFGRVALSIDRDATIK